MASASVISLGSSTWTVSSAQLCLPSFRRRSSVSWPSYRMLAKSELAVSCFAFESTTLELQDVICSPNCCSDGLVKSFSVYTGTMAWNLPPLLICIIIIRIYKVIFKSPKLSTVKRTYMWFFSCFKKSVDKLFYNSHFSMKRAFTFEYVVAWAGKMCLLPFSHNVRFSLRKNQSSEYGQVAQFKFS